MNFKEIKELVKLIGETGIARFELEDKEFKLSIINQEEQEVTESAPAPQMQMPQFIPYPSPMPQYAPPAPQPAAPVHQPTAAPQAPAAPAAPEKDSKAAGVLEVKSPIVGTFYRSQSPDKPAYVKVGDKIKKGDVVCIVEAMKLFNEIETEVSGTIVKVLIEDASPVEYDQVLFHVEPD